MPDREYKINYSAPTAKVERDIDRLVSKLKEADAAIERTRKNLRTLGSDTAGVTKAIAAMKALERELQAVGSNSGKAEKSLSGVGKGNRSVADLTARMKELEKQLIAVTKAAADATAAAAAAGGAGGGGGGGGSGGGGGGSAKGLGVKAMAKGFGVGLALMGARKLANAAGSSISGRREFFAQSADVASQFRQELQGLAVLQGKTFADDSLVREQLNFQSATGFNADEAREFRTEFGGAVAPGLATGNISKDTASGLELEAAKFGKRYDLGAFSTGRMAGLLGQYGKVPNVQSGMNQMAQAAEYTNVYGLGTPRQMMAPMVGLAADMLDSDEGGRFSSLESMAATFAATTFKAKSPAMAATQIRQANRILRSVGEDDKGQFLAGLGITKDTNFDEGVRKIAPAISGSDGDLILKNAGFGNSTERDSIRKQVELIKTIDEARKDPRIAAAGRNVLAGNADFQKTLTGQQASAENAEFSSVIEAGIANERLKTMRASARASLQSRDELKAGFGQSVADLYRSASNFGGVTGEELRVDKEAFENLVAGGKAVGVDVAKMAPAANYNATTMQAIENGDSVGQINKAFEAVAAAGGDPFNSAARKLREAANAVQGLGGKGGPPPPPRPGDGGAGVVPGRR